MWWSLEWPPPNPACNKKVDSSQFVLCELLSTFSVNCSLFIFCVPHNAKSLRYSPSPPPTMCYWFPRAQQGLPTLSYLWERSWDRWAALPIRVRYAPFFTSTSASIWVYPLSLGYPLNPKNNVLLISQGTTDYTYTTHLLYPFRILLFWVSGLLLYISALYKRDRWTTA